MRTEITPGQTSDYLGFDTKSLCAGCERVRKSAFSKMLLPETEDKIKRWHQTLKNRSLPKNYYLTSALEQAIGDFIEHHNYRKHHESPSNLTPADVYHR